MTLARRFTYLGVLVFALAAPFIGIYPLFATKLLCFVLFACAFNLLLGFSGLLSFGHAAFFGGAAYVSGWLAKAKGWTPESAVLAGVLFACVLGAIFGWVAIRRRGIYFAMITLALAQLMYFIFLQAPFVGGEDGLQGIPRGKIFGLLPLSSDLTMYYLVLAIFVGCFLCIIRVVSSPFGQVLKMVRENEPRAISLGYDVDNYKLIVFVISASLAGLAGGLKAIVMGFATLTDLHWSMSGEVIVMTLLGGVGTFVGPVLGTGFVIGLENVLAERAGAWVPVIIGTVFIVGVLAFRKGVVGEMLAWRERRKPRLAGARPPGLRS